MGPLLSESMTVGSRSMLMLRGTYLAEDVSAKRVDILDSGIYYS